MYEWPLVPIVPLRCINFLQGMDWRYNGHIQTITRSTNIRKNNGRRFRYATCVGHLMCPKSGCSYLRYYGHLNSIQQKDNFAIKPSIGPMLDMKCILICEHCKYKPQLLICIMQKYILLSISSKMPHNVVMYIVYSLKYRYLRG